ncbi:hypothetical protein [Spirosoma koreense]
MSELDNFISNNPNSQVEVKEDKIKINKPWNDDSFQLIISSSENLTLLDNIILVDYLEAIYHKANKYIEFIYFPRKTSEKILQRNFSFNYDDDIFRCYFQNSSKTLELIAKAFKPIKPPSETNYRGLRIFKDFFTVDDQPEFVKEFFQNSQPYSFYVEGNLDKYENDFSYLLTLLNFYIEYFDRKSPKIILYRQEKNTNNYKIPCFTQSGNAFPNIINATKMDLTVLETLDVARKTDDVRLKFIFYFQVLEYCTYYYLDNNIKKDLDQILKRPDINSKSTQYTKAILEKLQDHFYRLKDDSLKMDKTINDYLTIDDIKLELKENINFFCEDINFDGGLVITKLFSKPEDINNTSSLLSTVRKNIEKIRNVLVHLREQRENKVILPNPDNDKRLLPYLYVIKRMAENIALQYQ